MAIIKHFGCTVSHCSSGVLSGNELFLDASMQVEVCQLHTAQLFLFVQAHEHVCSLQVVMYDAVCVAVLRRPHYSAKDSAGIDLLEGAMLLQQFVEGPRHQF